MFSVEQAQGSAWVWEWEYYIIKYNDMHVQYYVFVYMSQGTCRYNVFMYYVHTLLVRCIYYICPYFEMRWS